MSTFSYYAEIQKPNMFSHFSNILLLGVIQGLILGIVLLFRNKNTLASKILAIEILFISIALFFAYLYSINYHLKAPNIIGVISPLSFLWGPLLYVYVLAMTSAIEKIKLRHLLHFLPVLLLYVYYIPLYLSPAEQKILYVTATGNMKESLREIVINGLIYVQGISYTMAALYLLIKYTKEIKEYFSDIDKVRVLWLRVMVISVLLIWITSTTLFVLYHAKLIFPKYLGIENFSVTIFIYICGYFMLKQPEIFNSVREMINQTTASEEKKHSEKYEKTGVSESTRDKYVKLLKKYMELKKPYKDSEITLKKLADGLEMSPHHLSQVINSIYNINFFMFINNYRLNEAMDMLKNNENIETTILNIAYEVGFNSKSSFNSHFKTFTGMTPTQYRKQYF